MRFLCRGLAGEDPGRCRQIPLAVLVGNKRPHRREGLPGDVGRVGAHVGDAARFVKALGDGHGLADAETQTVGRGLLQGGGDERRSGPGRGLPVHSIANGERALTQPTDGIVCRSLFSRPEFGSVLLRHLEPHGCLVGTRSRAQQVRKRFPILLGRERADLPFAVNDQAHGHRLHASGRESARHLGPQQGRKLEADHAVEEAPSLLRVDAMLVDNAGVGKGFVDGGLGDLVENHASVAIRRAAENLGEVPCDGLPLPVEVRGEIDPFGSSRQALQFPNHLFLARNHLVGSGPAVVRINAHGSNELRSGALLSVFVPLRRRQLAGLRGFLGPLLGALLGICGLSANRQVANMARTRLDDEVATEVAVDGGCLGGRLHDDQRTSHGLPCFRSQTRQPVCRTG